MMNMEAAICYMADHDFTEYENNLREFRKNCAKLPQITMIEKEAVCAAGAYGYDETRLVYSAAVPGPELLAMLADKGDVVCEMAGRKHVVLISTVRDGQEDFEQLYRTLQMCDVALTKKGIMRRSDVPGRRNCKNWRERWQEHQSMYIRPEVTS